jgi:hypothetical protein
MKKIVFLLILLLQGIEIYAQQNDNILEITTVEKLQGIWSFGVNAINDEERKKFDKDFEIYWMIKGNRYIDITLFKDDNHIRTFIWYFDLFDNERDTLIPKNISQLRRQGNYFSPFFQCVDSLGNILCGSRGCGITFNENGKMENQPDYFFLNWTGIPESHERIKELPKHILLKLRKSKKEWSIYQSFTDMLVKRIESQKCILYATQSEVNITKMYLLKNDEVEILDIKDEWLKIRFYGKKIIEGWIKKSDVE